MGKNGSFDELIKKADEIKKANKADVDEAVKNGMKPALIDRLTLTDARIEGMAEGLRQLVALEDPVGEITSMKQRPNGLMIGYKKVPLGVIAIIYESRPNVTVDAFGLTFKSGNAVILRGGSDSINSNIKLVEIIRDTLIRAGVCEDAVILISDTDILISAFMLFAAADTSFLFTIPAKNCSIVFCGSRFIRISMSLAISSYSISLIISMAAVTFFFSKTPLTAKRLT